MIIIGYSTVFCKIWDFICMSIGSAENHIGRAIASPMRFSAERIRVKKTMYTPVNLYFTL